MAKQEILLETGTNEFEILEFYINEISPETKKREKNYFGVNVAKVVEVIESPKLTQRAHPMNPSFLGTIPLREIVLPVVDLSIWLGIERDVDEHENIVVTEFSKSVQGFLISGVVEIYRLNWTDLIPPGKFLRKIHTRSIIGMIDKGDHLIQLLDLEHIVSDLSPESIEDSWTTDVKAEKAYKTLVVEDSPTIRKMLQKNLSRANFDVTMAANGQEGLDVLQGLKDQSSQKGIPISDLIDIVISDIEMPLVDGFTLTKNIKQDDMLNSLPVVLYSSIITDELRHKGESVNADYQVSKPDLDQMAQVAIQLIEKKEITSS